MSAPNFSALRLSPPASPARVAMSAIAMAFACDAAASAQPKEEHIAMSAPQIQRAGIVTAPAQAALSKSGSGHGDGVVLSGTVVAPPGSLVVSGSNWAGVVQQVHVNTLDAVKAGAPLATLFSQGWMDVQREYVQSSAQARLAADKLSRDQGLFDDGIIARARLDESRAAAQSTALTMNGHEQALRAAGLGAAAIKALPSRQQLSPLLTVRAQAAGTVLELPVAIGQQVEPGAVLARIARQGPLWVELQASPQQAPLLKPGAELRVGDDCRIKVVAVSPLVNGVNQTAQVRAEQSGRNACLQVNAFVEARLVQPPVQSGALAVPATALVRRSGANYVFVRNKAGFTAVPVKTGAVAGEQVWVQGALQAGAPVAARGVAAIKGVWSGLGEPAQADAGANAGSVKGQP